jgi:predicted acylesterase/phospholipase RssA/ABC-type phosphate/phosphonate transport system substrate-binding protein
MYRRLAGVCWLLSLAMSHAVAQQPEPGPELKSLRVGVIAYADPGGKVAEVDRILGKGSGLPPAEYAVGTYADVLDWIGRGLVDVAKLPPGAFAQTTEAGNTGPLAVPCKYVATEGKPSWTQTEWTYVARKSLEPYSSFVYNSVCLVRGDSGLASWDDVVKANARGEVQFIFTDPLSASGALLPMRVLMDANIPFHDRMEFSWGHHDSIELLLDAPRLTRDRKKDGKIAVAFTYDRVFEYSAAGDRETQLRTLLPLPIPLPKASGKVYGKATKLHEVEIPEEVWVTRQGYPDRAFDRLRELLRARTDRGVPTFGEYPGEFHSQFSAVRRWAKEVRPVLGLPAHDSDPADYNIPSTLRDIYGLMQKYQRTDAKLLAKPLRFALVLSGGGAKCAYQAGVVAELENALARFREEDKLLGGKPLPDIGVVVGTSGGALNALPIALKMGANTADQPRLSDTWRGLDIRKMVCPSWHVRVLLGLCLAYLTLLVLRPLARWTSGALSEGAPYRSASATVMVCAAAVGLYCLPTFLPSRVITFGYSHLLFYIVYGLSVASRWAATILIVLVALKCLGELFSKSASGQSRFRPLRLAWELDASYRKITKTQRRLAFAYLLMTFFFLLAAAVVGAALSPRALFEGDPLVATVAREYRQLFKSKFGAGKYSLDDVDRDLRLMSTEIVNRTEEHRDLVITGSLLGEAGGDKYFFWPGTSDPSVNPFPDRGIPIKERSNLLLDVTIGSGTIYPMFPARAVKGLKADPNKETHLIDGGFSHNSPIEAAVLWGATHILLIEASASSPQKGRRDASFASNAIDAFGYLYDQAQINDVRAKGNVAVFTLRPERPLTALLDFGFHFADRAITSGERDARSRRFVRQVASPYFVSAEKLKEIASAVALTQPVP